MLVSVIIPVYNVEQYLSRCLESVIDQSYNNLEIICINDGSSDKSLAILERYKEIDKRVKILDQANQGLSSARNNGIESSTGEYIFFLDSDDYIESDTILELVTTAKSTYSDITVCGIYYVTEDSRSSKTVPAQFTKSGYEIVIDYYKGKHDMQPMVWNKLYNKNIFKNLLFEKGLIHEDKYFTPKALYAARKVTFIPYIGYNYIVDRVDSITNLKFNDRNIAAIEAEYHNFEFFKKINEIKLANLALINYYKELPYYYCRFEDNNETIKKDIIKKSRKNIKCALIATISEYEYVSFTKGFIFSLFPNIYQSVWRSKNVRKNKN